MMTMYFLSTDKKMGYVVVDNLRGFTQHRPPLVVFMICLGLFAVALLSMAYYIKLNDVQNPDVSQVRKSLLKTFYLCIYNLRRVLAKKVREHIC